MDGRYSKKAVIGFILMMIPILCFVLVLMTAGSIVADFSIFVGVIFLVICLITGISAAIDIRKDPKLKGKPLMWVNLIISSLFLLMIVGMSFRG